MTSGDAGAPRVAIIGGGLAGLAAALRLNEYGCRAQLFEARRQLGGRAASFRDPARGGLVDYCQHASMGCCTNFADFAERTGIDGQFERFTALNLFAFGRKFRLAAAPCLPAPLHLLPAMLRLSYLPWRDRLQTIRLLLALARASDVSTTARNEVSSENMQAWLEDHKVSSTALLGFWDVILVSALGESVDHVSVAAARKVFVDGFMTNRRGYEVLVPEQSLSELIDQQVGSCLAQRGVRIERSSPVHELLQASSSEFIVQTDSGDHSADLVVVATSWRHVKQLVSAEIAAGMPEIDDASLIASAPITGVHLWFDRPITNLRHAIIVGRLSQWLFARPDSSGALTVDNVPSHYYQVVISGSHDLAGRSHEDVIAEVQSDLVALFDDAKEANLLQARVVTDPHAVFSYRPGLQRPGQRTNIKGLFLAGDWTDTAWPATMEGAVRSGYLAAEEMLNDLGSQSRLLAPDQPRSVLSRLLLGNK
jgi:squalene-associated FAD-dependent desaturase